MSDINSKAIHRVTTDTSTLLLALLIATLARVTFHAWRQGNERRDVALPGVFIGLCSVGTAATRSSDVQNGPFDHSNV